MVRAWGVGLVFALVVNASAFGQPSNDGADVSWQRIDAADPNEPTTSRETGGGFSGPRGNRGPGYFLHWLPNRPADNVAGDITLLRQHLSAGLPIWRDETDTVILNTNIRHTLAQTDIVLPDSGRAFPEQLWNVTFGVNHFHRFANGWSSGAMVNFGSASDRPFHSSRELNVMLIGFLRVPTANLRDAWLFSVMYSSAGNLNFPIPGVAYAWNPSDDFNMNIGIPFSLFWRPTDLVTFDFSYLPLTNINARLNYRVLDNTTLFVGYEFFNEAFFLADRVSTRDRFMGFEQRALAGLRFDLAARLALDVEGGYAFDRFFGEGRNQGSDLRDRVDIEPGAFVGVNLRMKF